MARWHHAALISCLVCVASAASGQVSTGTVAGLVADSFGGNVAGAEVVVTSQQTGDAQVLLASDEGRYVAPFLEPGRYTVQARRPPLSSPPMSVLVQAGTTVAVDLLLTPSPFATDVTVNATPAGRTEHLHVGGWVDREQIANQPLNGRNVFEMVKVEPGMTAPARLSGNRVFISTLGAGLNTIPRIGFTRVTVDGANIETPGTSGSLLQLSPDVVEQVHVGVGNFDPSVGLATSGAVDVVTRAGGDSFRATAFSLYRDRRWSSSAALSGTAAGDPAFRRQQAGATVSGPLIRDRAFFLTSYERQDQRDLVAIEPREPALQALAGVFESPFTATLLSARIDARLSPRHRLALRHVHDDNDAFTGQVRTLPSGWFERPIRAHLTHGTFTSMLAGTITNDLRASYYATDVQSRPASPALCQDACFGLGAPRIVLWNGADVMSLGASGTSSNRGNRIQLSDAVTWQHRAHLLRFGLDWERTAHAIFTNDSDPVTLTLWTPEAARQRNPGLDVPETITSLDDLLRLPLRSFTTSVGSGDVLQRGLEPERQYDTVRAYVGDRWTVGPHLTLNAGLAWSIETGVLNDDLQKPTWLAPLVDGRSLSIPPTYANLSGSFGAAWTPTGSGNTILRAAVGRYAESMARSVTLNLTNERVLLSPLGTGRQVVSGSNLLWNGERLNFPQPTAFTAADLLAALPGIRSSLTEALAPDNRDFSVVNLDLTKEGRNLYDPSYETPYAIHASAGVEHELPGRLRLGADVIWRRFDRTFINGIDYNRFLSVQGPVIPACTTTQRTDVLVHCSNGSLYFDTTMGRARYAGLLIRVDKHVAGRGRLLFSYALSRFVGTNGTGTATSEDAGGRVFGFNNDDYDANYGPLPTDRRHVLNVSGSVTVPWSLDVSFNLAAHSREPFAPYIAGVDFNGDGTINDLLPGTTINQFNRGLTKSDLVRLVADYNAQYAGKLTAGGQFAPFVTLPERFSFNDAFSTLDVRLARPFRLSAALRLTPFFDVFNVLDTMNLIGFGSNLASSAAFGQPGGRVGQAFGSGGPRAAQVGLRVDF